MCAAKFGRAYFFSVRLVETKASLLALLAVFCGAMLGFVCALKLAWDAWGFGGIISGGAVLFIAMVVAKVLQRSGTSAPSGALVFDGSQVSIVGGGESRSEHDWRGGKAPAAARPGMDLKGFFFSLPLVGGWIERHGRETYYRYDTRLLYLSLVNEIVRKQVEEVTAAKGVRFIETHEYSPIFGELYKTVKKEQAARTPEPVPV